MAEGKAGKEAPARKKAAPRTKGTPKAPPKPRKVTAAPKPRAPRESPPAVRDAQPPAAPPRWQPAPAPVWQPAPAPPARTLPAPAPRPFDPATGAWTIGPVAPATGAAPAADPAAYRKGTTRSILLNVVLGIDLGLLALFFLFGLIVGIVLVFAPDSELAQDVQGSGISSPTALAVEMLLTFLMVGAIPFLWVLGTRVRAWQGTVQYLSLRGRARDWLLGVALVPAMLLAVIALSIAYTCVVDGCGALDDPPAEDEDAIDAIFDNLTWTVAVIVALSAGIGEEILFRGVLRKWLGTWGQAVAFGLAHAANGYPPQVLFAFGMGVVFGYLMKRGWSLVSLIVAHVLYDFVLLSLALLYPDLA